MCHLITHKWFPFSRFLWSPNSSESCDLQGICLVPLCYIFPTPSGGTVMDHLLMSKLKLCDINLPRVTVYNSPNSKIRSRVSDCKGLLLCSFSRSLFLWHILLLLRSHEITIRYYRLHSTDEVENAEVNMCYSIKRKLEKRALTAKPSGLFLYKWSISRNTACKIFFNF